MLWPHQADRPERAVPRPRLLVLLADRRRASSTRSTAARRATLDAAEEVLLDVNELAKGQKFFSVGPAAVSDDGNLLAYAHRHDRLPRVLPLASRTSTTGKLLEDQLVKVDRASPGRRTTRRSSTSPRTPPSGPTSSGGTRVGEPKDKDALVYEEKDELFRLGVSRSRDRQVPVPLVAQFDDDRAVRYLPADKPTGDLADDPAARGRATSTPSTTATACSTSAPTRTAQRTSSVVTCPGRRHRPDELEGVHPVQRRPS